MKLSIIVPVYNTGANLKKCVEQIFCQSLNDWELIIVDDGSTDGSSTICDSFAHSTSIRVIHKSNGGLSDARNRGINVATGDFVTFIDSDDFVHDGTLGEMMTILSNHPDTDILEYPIKAFRPEGEKIYTFADKTYDSIEEYWLGTQAYRHTFACNKLFRRSLFDEVSFPVGKTFEDAWTLPLLLRHNPKVRTTAKGMYHYSWNPEGITATASGKDLEQLLLAQITASDILGLSLLSDACSHWYLDILNRQLDVNSMLHHAPLLPNRRISLKVASSASERIKIILLNFFGINSLCKFNRLIRRKR